MSELNIEVAGGTSTRLLTAGKYCDKNIVVVASGGEPAIEALDITANGTYTAPDGVDGYSPVTVNVPQDGAPPEEAFVITGDCTYRFAHNGWNWFIENHGDKITTKDINSATNMFSNSSDITEIPLEFNFVDGGCETNGMFGYCKNLKSVPSIDFKHTNTYKNTGSMFISCEHLTSIGALKNMYPSSLAYFFGSCYLLRELPAFENLNLDRIHSYNYAGTNAMFNSCRSLRNIPTDILRELYIPSSTTSYQVYYNGFTYCSALDELVGLPVNEAVTVTSTLFYNTFTQCCRLKSIIFETNDDGSAKTAKWKSQTIELSGGTGADYAVGNTFASTWVTDYNSGITEDKRVYNDETYQALKDDPDWFTTNRYYSRYNHDSAVETINSLPDTSAYLATAGGTNTIKFRGDAGLYTDGGAINTLTEEEIAVATAKGWTVTLV